MADNIANILMRISGESSDADDTLGAFLGKLKAFGSEKATAEADVNVSGAEKLTALGAQLAKFDKSRAIAEASVNVQTASLTKAFAELKAFEDAPVRKIEIPVEVQRAGMDRALEEIRTKISDPRFIEISPQINRREARAELTALLAELSAAITTASSSLPDIDIDVNLKQVGASTGLATFIAAVNAVADQKVELDVDTSQLLTVPPLLAAIEAGLKAIGDEKVTLDLDSAPAVAQLAVFRAAVNAIADNQIDVKPVVDTTNIQGLRILLESLGDEDVTVNVNTKEGEARLAAFLVAAHGVARDIHVDVEVDDKAATAALAGLIAEIKVADAQRINIDTDVSKLSLAARLMEKLGSVFASIGNTAGQAAQSIGGVTVNLGAFGLKLTTTTAAVLALVIAMGVSLVAAASLLVVALAGAAAAVGALATAFVGALGPAVAVAVATFQRITKIVQALKAKTAADKAAAAGSSQSAAAEERRHNALLAVGQAARAVTGAENALEQARASAREGIASANRDQAAASQAAANAAKTLQTETVNAYDAMRQAAEDVRDAILDVADAQQGINDSQTALKRAQFELKQLRNEAGLLGGELNDTFKKFTDVDFKPTSSAFAGLLKGAKGGAGVSPEEQQIKLEEAINRVRNAKLQEQRATDNLGDAEKNLSDKRKVEADFARQGINAYAPYTAAIQANEQAKINLALATDRANKLEKQGIDNAPGVIAAQDALTNANIRLKEARHDSAIAAQGAAGGAAARKAKADWDALTTAEQAFGLALQRTANSVKTAFGPAINGVLAGLAGFMAQVPSIIGPLKGQFAGLGTAIGDAFANFGTFLADPKVNAQLGVLVDGATQLAAILGTQAFTNFSQLMLNLATVSMPLLIDATKRLTGFLGDLANRTSDTAKLSKSINSLGGFLFDVLGFVRALGRVFLAFFGATSGQSKNFLKTITDMTNKFADFLGSTKGQQQLKDFFAVMIPLAIESFKAIGGVIVFLIQIIEILAPALTGFLSAFNLLLGVVNSVLNVLKPFLQIAGQIALLFIGGIPAGIATVIGKFKVLEFFFGGFIGFLKSHFLGVITSIIGKFSFLASVFPGIFDVIKKVIRGFIDFVERVFGGIVHVITAPFREALKILGDLGKEFFDAGKHLFNMLVDGIKSVIGKAGGIVKKGLGLIGHLIPHSEPKDHTSPLFGLKESGKAIMENMAKGIPLGADNLTLALHRSLVPVVAGIDTNLTLPRRAAPVGATAASVAAGPSKVENHYHIQAPAGALPDAEATVRAIARRNERRGGGSPRA